MNLESPGRHTSGHVYKRVYKQGTFNWVGKIHPEWPPLMGWASGMNTKKKVSGDLAFTSPLSLTIDTMQLPVSHPVTMLSLWQWTARAQTNPSSLSCSSQIFYYNNKWSNKSIEHCPDENKSGGRKKNLCICDDNNPGKSYQWHSPYTNGVLWRG